MHISNIVNHAQQWLRSHRTPSEPFATAYLAGATIYAARGNPPLRIQRLEGEESVSVLLSKLNQSPSTSTRSIHTLIALQQNCIDAAALALKNLKEDASELRQLAQQLDAARFKEDRPACKEKLKVVNGLRQDLIDLISVRLRRASMSPNDAARKAWAAFSSAKQSIFNAKPWCTVITHFTRQNIRYDCAMVPAERGRSWS